MKWPWSKSEIRSSGYTDLIIAGLESRADGSTSTVRAIAALEIASGLWGRSLASATVAPSSAALAGLTPAVIGDIGTRLCRSGEAVYTLSVEGGAVRLHPVSDWDVQGGFDPESWVYRCQLAGPSRTIARMVESAGVLHVRYSSDARQPWIGVSPLARCPATATLAANLETRLSQEAGGPVGSFLSVPEGSNPDGDMLADLRTGIAGAKGAPVLHETVVKGYGDPGDAPHGDLRPVRFGASWPAAVAELRDPIGQSVALACGIPTALVSNSDGTAAREGLRRFLTTTIRPVARIIETELRAKLDPTAALSFSELAGSDLTGKARAIGSLVKAGMSIEDARAVASL